MADKKVKVTVTDQTGSNPVTAELPGDAEMSRLIPALITKLKLPADVKYKIQHKQSGKELADKDTLIDAGVKEGDTLRIFPDVVAG